MESYVSYKTLVSWFAAIVLFGVTLMATIWNIHARDHENADRFYDQRWATHWNQEATERQIMDNRLKRIEDKIDILTDRTNATP